MATRNFFTFHTCRRSSTQISALFVALYAWRCNWCTRQWFLRIFLYPALPQVLLNCRRSLKKICFDGREGVLPSYESSIWVTGMIEHRSNIVETDSVDNSLWVGIRAYKTFKAGNKRQKRFVRDQKCLTKIKMGSDLECGIPKYWRRRDRMPLLFLRVGGRESASWSFWTKTASTALSPQSLRGCHMNYRVGWLGATSRGCSANNLPRKQFFIVRRPYF